VKRALDRRPAALLAGHGVGADHPSAAANIALVEVVAERPCRRILNAADPDAPATLAISRMIAAVTGRTGREVLLNEDPSPQLGRHPWHRIPSIVLDTSAAQALGYQPVGDCATTVTDEIDWMVGQVRLRGRRWLARRRRASDGREFPDIAVGIARTMKIRSFSRRADLPLNGHYSVLSGHRVAMRDCRWGPSHCSDVSPRDPRP
jgi:hypothetical protein